MGEAKFSIGEALRAGIRLLRENMSYVLPVLLAIYVVSDILPLLFQNYSRKPVPIGLGFPSKWWQVAHSLLVLLAYAVAVNLALKLRQCQRPAYRQLLPSPTLAAKFLVAGILYTLLKMGGFALLIVPGIILSIALQFYAFLVLDRGLGPIAALKESASITQGARMTLFYFGVIESAIMFGIVALPTYLAMKGVSGVLPTVLTHLTSAVNMIFYIVFTFARAHIYARLAVTGVETQGASTAGGFAPAGETSS